MPYCATSLDRRWTEMQHSIRTIVAGAVAVVTAAALGIAAPVAESTRDDSTASKRNIVQTAVAAGQFKTLASLLKTAGLAGTLQKKGPYTVFAPTDAAFAKVPKATLAALGKDKAKLRAVLLYHV